MAGACSTALALALALPNEIASANIDLYMVRPLDVTAAARKGAAGQSRYNGGACGLNFGQMPKSIA
jgi:hypothetical protein